MPLAEAQQRILGAVGALPPRAVATGQARPGGNCSLETGEGWCQPGPRVEVCSPGDELVAAGPLAPGVIRDSNRPMLLAVLAEAGCDAVDYGIARDDEQALTATITAAV